MPPIAPVASRELPPPPVSYTDFAAWHRDWMTGPELARQLAFWRAKLDGAPGGPGADHRPAAARDPGRRGRHRVAAHSRRDAARAARARPRRGRDPVHDPAGAVDPAAAPPERAVRGGGGHAGARAQPARARNRDGLLRQRAAAAPARRPGARTSWRCCARCAPRWWTPSAARTCPSSTSCACSTPAAIRAASRSTRPSSPTRTRASARPHWGNLEHHNLPVFQPSAAQDLALWFLDGVDGLVGGLNYNSEILLPATAALLGRRYLALADEVARAPQAGCAGCCAPTRTSGRRSRAGTTPPRRRPRRHDRRVPRPVASARNADAGRGAPGRRSR